MLKCETCKHWQGSHTAYAAPCALASYPGRVSFDMGCDKHSSTPQTPVPDMQSQARGPMVPWAKVWQP